MVGFRLKVVRTNPKALERIAKSLTDTQRRAILAVAKEVIEAARSYLIANESVASGELLKSFVVREEAVNQFAVRYRVANTAPYAVWVEFGRRPGAEQPPPEAMEQYVLQKNIVSFIDPEMSAMNLGYLIGKKIAEDGIAPLRFMAQAAGPESVKFFKREMVLGLNSTIGKESIISNSKKGSR